MWTLGKSNQKHKKKKSHIPFRLNLLFFIVFILFSAIIVRLGYLQIIRGDEFEAIVRRTETTIVTQNVPRGLIYDRNGNVLVGNEAQHAVIYTRGTDDTATNMAETAGKLAEILTVDAENLTERDLKDYWAATHREALLERMTEEEKLLSGDKVYEVELSKITEEDINFSDEEKQAVAIFKSMNSATALTTVNIKNVDVTNQELAMVSENISSLPGIDISKDWTRVYPHGDLLKTILGGVTSEKAGIPTNLVESYLAKGYARNDRVGNAYLEQQYETVLRGSKAQYETITNQDGETIKTTQSYVGKQGNNLLLTTDIEFQKKIEEIATNYLESGSDSWGDRIYIVAMDPNNGDIIGMTGKQIDKNTGEVSDNVHGVLNESFIIGSSMKGATVLAGYMDGVISETDNTMIDEPMKFEATNKIASLFNQSYNNQVPLSDILALEKSSNTYMAKIAMMMGGKYTYEYEEKIDMDMDLALAKLRTYYGQFGLGVRTGIDLPSESTGYLGEASDPGQVLFEAFGQYDNYTPLQLGQYIATIANGGTRYAPRLVKEIRGTNSDGSLGPVELVKEPKIMNQLNVSSEAIARVHQGMWQVMHSPTAASTRIFGADYAYRAAGKTGTGESFYQGSIKSLTNEESTNSTFVAFAPFENPEISIAVVIPYLLNDTSPSTVIAKEVLDAYFKD